MRDQNGRFQKPSEIEKLASHQAWRFDTRYGNYLLRERLHWAHVIHREPEGVPDIALLKLVPIFENPREDIRDGEIWRRICSMSEGWWGEQTALAVVKAGNAGLIPESQWPAATAKPPSPGLVSASPVYEQVVLFPATQWSPSWRREINCWGVRRLPRGQGHCVEFELVPQNSFLVVDRRKRGCQREKSGHKDGPVFSHLCRYPLKNWFLPTFRA